MTTVAIVTGVQIIDNPRVIKEADSLTALGYDVVVLDVVNDSVSRARIDRTMATRSWRRAPIADFTQGPLARIVLGLKTRFYQILGRLGVQNPGQLGAHTHLLYRAAKRTKADLYIVHIDQACFAGVRLLDEGRRVAMDCEDWYSEDGLPTDRATRPEALMKAWERKLLNEAAFVTTTSNALADALAEAYGGQRPTVVYNSFPTEERAHIDGLTRQRKDPSVPSIFWFSQTVGPGRGLEALVDALSAIDRPFELHILGKPRVGYAESLVTRMPAALRERAHFHFQVPQEELLSRIAEHDIGYCGEISDCRSRDLTITNKAFEYMRAGLAVVASDTAGQIEVAKKARGAVFTFKQGDAASLREPLERLLSNPALLGKTKAASYAALEAHFDCAQSQARLKALVSRVLGPPQ